MLYPSQRNRNIWRRQPLSGCLWVYKAQQWSLELGENLKKPRLPRKKLTVFKKKKKKPRACLCTFCTSFLQTCVWACLFQWIAESFQRWNCPETISSAPLLCKGRPRDRFWFSHPVSTTVVSAATAAAMTTPPYHDQEGDTGGLWKTLCTSCSISSANQALKEYDFSLKG